MGIHGESSQGKVLSPDDGGLFFTAFGVALSILGPLATSRLLESLLYGISRVDLTTYGCVIACLEAAVDPAVTLRSE